MNFAHLARAAVAGALAFALSACSMLSAGPDMRMGAAPARYVAATPFTATEKEFVKKVAVKGVYKIEVSRLAAERALSPAVREYAQTLLSHHTQLNDELVELMSAHGVAPPKGLPADRATKLHKLAALPRSDAFDSGYIRVVGIEDHRSAIALFEKARSQVRDRDLRAWIERAITIMRADMGTAQGVASSLAG